MDIFKQAKSEIKAAQTAKQKAEEAERKAYQREIDERNRIRNLVLDFLKTTFKKNKTWKVVDARTENDYRICYLYHNNNAIGDFSWGVYRYTWRGSDESPEQDMRDNIIKFEGIDWNRDKSFNVTITYPEEKTLKELEKSLVELVKQFIK